MTSRACRAKRRPRAKPVHGSPNEAILDRTGVAELLGFRTPSAVYRAMKSYDDFPAPFRPLHRNGYPRWWRAAVVAWRDKHFPLHPPSEENGERA